MSERNEETQESEGVIEYGSREDLDEIGQRYATPTPTDYSKVTLDGEDIPEAFRGKSVSDLVTTISRLGDALKVSEDARVALKTSSEALAEARRAPPPAAPPPAPQPDPELNDEQLQALYDESPRKYQDYLAQQSERRMTRMMQGYLAPVVGNSADMALREARQRFPEEFVAFGKDIEKFVSEMPDKNILATPGAVDQMMDYMRGKNWKAFQDHIAAKQNGSLREAQHQLSAQTPADFSRSPAPAPVPRSGGGARRPVQLDDTMKEIAAILGVSEEDYAKGLTDRDLRMIRSYGNR